MSFRVPFLVASALTSMLLVASGCGERPKGPVAEQSSTTKSSVTKPAVPPEPNPPPLEGTGPGGPPKPPIIIDPGDGGLWKINAESAVADPTMTGNRLNECAFGTKNQFYAYVQTPTNPNRKVDLVAAVASIGGKTLDISADGTGQFIWRLDNQVLVPYRPAAMARWREDLMTAPSWIQIASFEELQQPYTILGVGTKASGSCLNP